MTLEPYPIGSEHRINTITVETQRYSAVAALADGGYVVSWSGRGSDDREGIFARRYKADGSADGDAFRVNTRTTGTQQHASIAAVDDGGFVIAWSSLSQDGSNYGIYAQRYRADGSTHGTEFRVNTETNNEQSTASIAALGDGGFLISWTSAAQDGDRRGIFAQRYDSDGTAEGEEFQVNSATAQDQAYSSAAATTDGGFVITWSSMAQDGSGYGIYAQRFNPDGTALGPEFQVNSFTAQHQTFSSVAALRDGGFVITWSSLGQDGSSYGVYAQRYDRDGATAGDEFRVNTVTAGEQANSSVSALDDGGFAVVWHSARPDGSNVDVYAQRFDAAGSRIGGEFLVNETTSGNQKLDTQPRQAISQLADGSLVITWGGRGEGDDIGIMARRFHVAKANTPPKGRTARSRSTRITATASLQPISASRMPTATRWSRYASTRLPLPRAVRCSWTAALSLPVRLSRPPISPCSPSRRRSTRMARLTVMSPSRSSTGSTSLPQPIASRSTSIR